MLSSDVKLSAMDVLDLILRALRHLHRRVCRVVPLRRDAGRPTRENLVSVDLGLAASPFSDLTPDRYAATAIATRDIRSDPTRTLGSVPALPYQLRH